MLCFTESIKTQGYFHFQDALSVPIVVKNYLGKPVTLILESKDFKFFKYGENPSKSSAAKSPQQELQYEESVELDLTRSVAKSNLEHHYVSQLKQQSEQEEASLKVKVQGERGYFDIPGKNYIP